MKIAFIAKLAFLLFANLLVKPLYIFGVEVKVQNLVGAEVYGQYLSVFNLSIIFGTLLDFGINNYHNQRISQYPQELNERFLPTLTLKMGLSLLYGLVVFATAILLHYSAAQLQLLAIILVGQVMLSLLIYNRSTLSALQFFGLDSLASVLDKLLMIFIIGGGAIWWQASGGSFSIVTFAFGQTLAYSVAVVVTSFFVLYKNKHLQAPSFNFNSEQYKKILSQSLPFALLAMLMGLYTRIDGIMLERMLPDNGYQAGVYAAGFRLLDAANQFALLIGYWLLSVFSKLFNQKNYAQIWLLGSRLWAIIFFGSLAVSAFCWHYQQAIMQYLYTNATAEYGLVFGFLMLSLPSMALLYVVGTLLTAAGKLRLLNTIALLGVLLNFTLNYWLIPSFGALGAAIATVFTQNLVIGIKTFYAYKVVKL